MKRGLALVLMLFAAGPVLADGVLPIAGAFGNGTGCTLFMTGQMLDADAVILTPDNFVANDKSCHFLELTETIATGFTVSAACGDPAATQLHVRSADVGYFVSIGAAVELGPLSPCPGAQDAFKPLGTKV